MKKLYGVLAFVCFLLVFGTIGAMDQNMVSFSAGAFRCAAGLFGMVLFGKLSRLFEI